MNTTLTERVEQACHRLATDGQPVTFPAVADLVGVSRATLYRRPELRAIIEEHRHHSQGSLTLTALAVQLDQLRTGLEAVAAKVRRQEEELRQLRRTSPNTPN